MQLLQQGDALQRQTQRSAIPQPLVTSDSITFLHSLLPWFDEELAVNADILSLLNWSAFSSTSEFRTLPQLASDAREQGLAAGALSQTIRGGATPQIPTADRALHLLNSLRSADQALKTAAERAQLALADQTKRPAAMIVSGGISLGSYEAGLLHYYTQFQLAQRRAVKRISPELAALPQTVTGASAGAINAFLAAIAGCREQVSKPEESLFYQLWIPVGIDNLLDTDAVTATSLLSRKGIDQSLATFSRIWNDTGWSQDGCRANIGINVTRAIPRFIQLNQSNDQYRGILLPLQTEHLLLSLNGGNKKPPSVWSWVPSASQADSEFYERFQIRTTQADLFPTELSDVLKASSAFPVAWPFVYLRVPSEGARKPFLDGGVFDNNPLRLARNIIKWSSNEADLDGDVPGPIKNTLPGPQHFLYVDPDATAWEPPYSATGEVSAPSFIDTYVSLLQSFADTARKADLLSTIQEDPSLRGRIDVPVRNAPVMGAYLLNFFAFFDEDFRRYDFYSGMADAMEALEGPDGQATKLRTLGLDVTVHVDSQAFECVKGFRAARPIPKSAKDIRACANVFEENADSVHNRNFLALLDTSTIIRRFIDSSLASGRYSVGEEFSALLTALKTSGFAFSDAALGSDDPSDVVRNKLHPLFDALARKQPGVMGPAGVSVGLKAAADAVKYRPAGWWMSVGLNTEGGLEYQYSTLLSSPFRFALGVRIYRIVVDKLPTVGHFGLSYGLHPFVLPLSIEFAPGPWWLQIGMGFGLGLDFEFVKGATLAGSRKALEFEAHVALLQRVSLAINTSLFGDSCPTDCSEVRSPFRADSTRLAPGMWEWGVTLSWHWME